MLYQLTGSDFVRMCRIDFKDYIYQCGRHLAGIAFPRLSTSGSLLPSARLVSATIHWDRNNPHHIYTLVLMSMGQFIDHDISRTAVVTLEVDDGGKVNSQVIERSGR